MRSSSEESSVFVVFVAVGMTTVLVDGVVPGGRDGQGAELDGYTLQPGQAGRVHRDTR